MLKRYGRRISRVWSVVDVTIAAIVFAWLLSRPGFQREDFPADLAWWAPPLIGLGVGIGWGLVMQRFGLYGSQRLWNSLERTFRLLAAHGLGALVLSTLAFTLDLPVHRNFPLVFAGTLFLIESTMRITAFAGLGLARRAGTNYRNILIVGAGPLAAAARERLVEHSEWGMRIVGFLDDGHASFVPSVPADEIHKLVDLPMLLRNESIDEVMVACPRAMIGTLEPVVRECAMIGVPVILLSDLFGDVLPPPRVGRFDSSSTLCFAPVHHGKLDLAVKRAIDIVGAAAGVLISAPILALAALAIRLDSKGPILFRQSRCGRNGRRFEMLKLRTMVVDAEEQKASLAQQNEMSGPVFKIRHDPRITPVGRWLRKWSIDELPQLWNVLRGEMSLVGPRPPTPDEVLQYQGTDRRRLSMRPGLTCLWQISGRNDVSFEQWMRLDLDYIDHWSLASDLRIILATVPAVFFGRGAS